MLLTDSQEWRIVNHKWTRDDATAAAVAHMTNLDNKWLARLALNTMCYASMPEPILRWDDNAKNATTRADLHELYRSVMSTLHVK